MSPAARSPGAFVAILSAAVLCLVGLSAPGCGDSGTGSGVPDVSGHYRGALAFPGLRALLPGGPPDTLEVSAEVTQQGGTFSGSWTAAHQDGSDSLSGPLSGTLVREGTSGSPTYRFAIRLSSTGAGCAGAFDLAGMAVNPAQLPGQWELDGTLGGAVACYRAGSTQAGEVTLIRFTTAQSGATPRAAFARVAP